MSRTWPVWAAPAAALAVSFALATPVGYTAMRSHGTVGHPPTAADAAVACKTAIEADAQYRLTQTEDAGSGVFATFGGVDVDAPTAAATGGWTVNGSELFTVTSTLGVTPLTVLVVCHPGPPATVTGRPVTPA